MKALTPALRDALARDRDRYAVSAGPLPGYFPGAVRRAAEGAIRTLGVDRLDVFQLYRLGKMSTFTGAVREEMVRLREEGKVPTAGDCYRYCLSSPHVDLVLTGPRSVAEFRENLAAMEKGPLSPQEMEEIRAFGRAVHG